MLMISVVVGVLSALGGYALAAWVDGAIAGAMAVVSGGLYVLAALASPRHGVLPRLLRQRRRAVRVATSCTWMIRRACCR